jgi:hypothetical protein
MDDNVNDDDKSRKQEPCYVHISFSFHIIGNYIQLKS